MTENYEIVLDTKLVGSITGKFYIPSYQRGYRWGEEEVTRLLEDILFAACCRPQGRRQI